MRETVFTPGIQFHEEKGGLVALFGTDPVFRAHPQGFWGQVDNAIFCAMY
ncbi:MAG: hypothetical protein AB1576_11165 [Bacillota bacterium]